MKRILTLLAVMVAVPVVAFAVASGIAARDERDWQHMLAQRYSDVPAARRATLTIAAVCGDPSSRGQVTATCEHEGRLALMRHASVVTALSGVGWLAIIAAAGRLSRRNRRLLATVFRPGLHFTAIFAVLLIAAHAVLAIAALYLGEAALIGRVHVGIVFGIAVGALFGVIAVARGMFSVVRAVTTTVVGKTVSATESPELWRLVRDTAAAVNTAAPAQIVAGLDVNFFVTESSVRCLNGELHGRTLFISLPLARILSHDEFRAILGHELGHYKGEDTAFSRKFYPIYRGTHDALQGLEASAGDGVGSLALLPATAILSFFLNAFEVAESEIGRERELAADRVGAAVVGPAAAASALVKVHAFSGYWPAIREEMGRALAEGKSFTNVSDVFAQVTVENAAPASLDGLDEQRLSHPTDSHPPLRLRLANLGISLAAATDASLAVQPDPSAWALVADAKALEEELSQVEHYLLGRSLGLVPAAS